MQLTFLGTSAGESYPAIWCDCPYCTYARQHGGRNLRTNSCAMVDGDLLLDLSHGGVDTAARAGLSLAGVKTLLVTHPHEDHLYPQHLFWRCADETALSLPFSEKMHRFGPRFTEISTLEVYGNAYTAELLTMPEEKAHKHKLHFTEIKEGVPFETNGYLVTPVRNAHGPEGFSHSYILEKGGRTMLYALDTGRFDPDMQEVLKKHTYNLIVMEGTFGLNPCGEGHMCLDKNVQMLRFFRENGLCAGDMRFVLTHMAPHWTPPHDLYETIAANEGMLVAYDGMRMDV